MPKSLGKTRKKIRVWCPGGGTSLGGCSREDKRGVERARIKPKYRRCPVCDQRFELMARDTEPDDARPDIHYSIPPHKAY